MALEATGQSMCGMQLTFGRPVPGSCFCRDKLSVENLGALGPYICALQVCIPATGDPSWLGPCSSLAQLSFEENGGKSPPPVDLACHEGGLKAPKPWLIGGLCTSEV